MSALNVQLYLNRNNSLLHHITVSRITAGERLFYIGDTSNIINRIDTGLVCLPSRTDRYIPWNPIKDNPSVLSDVFLDTWYEGQINAGSSHYIALEHLYLTASLTVLKDNNLNLIHLPYFLANPVYRTLLLENIKDRLLKDFWSRPLDFKDVASIFAKTFAMLLNPSVRRMFSSHRNQLDTDVVLVDFDLPRTEKKLLGSIMLSQSDHFIVVEDCSLYSPKVLINLINEGRPMLLGFDYREQLTPQLYDAITGKCRCINATTARAWGEEIEPKPFDWKKHDRQHTRATSKADNDIRIFLESLD